MLPHYFFDQSVEPGQDLEVCYPVSQPIAVGAVQSHVLEGGRMLCAMHAGPLGVRGEPGSITDAWRAIFGHVRQHSVIANSVPRRELCLEGPEEHGDDTACTLTEAQLAYKFYRVERLAENLERYAGETVRREVMTGSERYASCSYCERAEWYKAAMARLDGLVGDEDVCRDIMITVGDQFPRARIREMAAFYERTGDLDALLALMAGDRTLCHCRLLAESIQTGLTLSRTYCYCGAGWYQQLWDGIMGGPVRVELLKSILQGDDRCSFAIHLPLA